MLVLFGVFPPRTNTSSSSLDGGKPEAALNSESLLGSPVSDPLNEFNRLASHSVSSSDDPSSKI